MGLGLGQLVTRDVSSLPGGDYLSFLGPGIMAATCMQSAVFESTFPIMGKIMWRRNYEAMLATPIEVRHILGGELLWIGFRMVLISSVFLVVLTLFRIPTSFLALLAVPACVLTGRGLLGGDHQLRRHPEERLRLRGAVPLRHQPALPVQRHLLPAEHAAGSLRWVEWIAAATPLYHGVALVRGAVLNDPGTLAGLAVACRLPGHVRLGLRGRGPSAPEPQAGEVDGRTDGSHRSAPPGTDADPALGLVPPARPAAGPAQPARLPARLDHHRVRLLRAALLPAGHRLRARQPDRRGDPFRWAARSPTRPSWRPACWPCRP